MYNFLLNLWIMKRATEVQINAAVTKGYISRQEGDMILATPQVP